MISGLRRSLSGLGLSQPLVAERASAQGDEEQGLWRYLVVDPSGCRPRAEASYTKEGKSEKARLREGTVVNIGARRRGGLTTWLQLNDGGGWLHDVSPKDHKVRLIEVELSEVSLFYQVTAASLLVLPRPSMQLSARAGLSAFTGESLRQGQLISVVERVRPLNGKGSFFKLGDGRGWVTDMSKGQQVLMRWENGDRPRLDGGASAESWESEMSPQPQVQRSMSSFGDVPPDPPQMVSETGSWNYIVLDPCGMHLRGSPTYDKAAKLESRVLEGQVVEVVERRSGNGTTFLRLASPSGWAFDVQPSASRRQRLTEVAVERGAWLYRVVPPRGVPLRSRCSASDDARLPSLRREAGAVLHIQERVRVGEASFLRLDDADTWVAERHAGKLLMEGPLEETLPPSAEAACAIVRAGPSISLLGSPTKRRWAQTNKVLLPGAQVQLVRKVFAEDESWWYVKQPGGMEGWAFAFYFVPRPVAAPFEAPVEVVRCSPVAAAVPVC